MTANAGMAELFGRIDGSSRGKGGSMHFFDAEHHFYGGHGIVGGQIPVGVGMGFACKYKGTGGVALTFFGDGALNQGAFHEAANLAALYKVPVLIIVENNAYAMGTSVERSRGDADLSKSGYPYGMTSVVIDGMDLFEVYHAFKTIADEARADGRTREGKPFFVEVQTYRYRGHSMSDPQKYRTKEELESKKDEDPIVRVKQYLIDHDLVQPRGARRRRRRGQGRGQRLGRVCRRQPRAARRDDVRGRVRPGRLSLYGLGTRYKVRGTSFPTTSYPEP